MKIRFVKNHPPYSKGQTIEVSTSKGLKLIKGGFAIIDRMFDMYQVKS